MQHSIFVFIGPPGSGKGSLSQMCVETLGWKQLSTGALCRKHIAEGTLVGKQIDLAIKSGKLIDDNLVLDMVSQWLNSLGGGQENIILDGFPRTRPQALALMNLLNEQFKECNLKVIEFFISDEEAARRLAARYVCTDKKCEAIYSERSSELAPLNNKACDRCGNALERRSDDQPDTVKQRLATYHKHADPLLAFYREAGQPIVRVDVEKPLEAVYKEFLALVTKDKLN
ncbi:MAG: adenylate kinase family protein [Candidatus Babeliales bacterium]